MVDFTQLDSRAAAENGAWLHLRHPATGELMMDGDKPCMVQVRGMESRSAIKAASDAVRKRKPGDTLADIEANHAKNIESASALIMAFDGVSRGPKPATVPDDVDWFLSLGIPVGNAAPEQRTFAEQVNAFAIDRANFLGNGSRP